MSETLKPVVVAVDVDGVLRVPPLDRGAGELSRAGVYEATVRVFREHYPVAFHDPAGDWSDAGAIDDIACYSAAGAAWLQRLVADPRVIVCWATTWQEYANAYFAPVLGIPPLEVGVNTRPRLTESSASWKARALARRFAGHPLVWVDDNPTRGGDRGLARHRETADRPLTRVHQVRDPLTGISTEDIAAIDEWVAMAATETGRDHLRRRWSRDVD
ncbi:hypothetical protein R2Q81_10440 [Microbacterium aquimaris]|uniref:hypothetical protein n=1 Tax=Microbacterium aquimaris TaxID=459816 RepID=UPI002AD4F0C8|nr:hypothetical protein [Microbacterium aquimaris]MDZ8276363.1 hypothetical protein [Microbacterium aquimaris]